jgi:hypothetical protein
MSPEMKVMLGGREADSDGFTYVHGKYKNGYIKRTRNRLATIKHIRHDKRKVKARELEFEFKMSGM